MSRFTWLNGKMMSCTWYVDGNLSHGAYEIPGSLRNFPVEDEVAVDAR